MLLTLSLLIHVQKTSVFLFQIHFATDISCLFSTDKIDFIFFVMPVIVPIDFHLLRKYRMIGES